MAAATGGLDEVRADLVAVAPGVGDVADLDAVAVLHRDLVHGDRAALVVEEAVAVTVGGGVGGRRGGGGREERGDEEASDG